MQPLAGLVGHWCIWGTREGQMREEEVGGKGGTKDKCKQSCGSSTLLVCTVSTYWSTPAPSLLSGDPEPQEAEAGTQELPSPHQTWGLEAPLGHWRERLPPSPPSQLPAWQWEGTSNAQLAPNHPSSFPPLTAFPQPPIRLASGCRPGPHESKTSDAVFLVKMLGVLFWVTHVLPRSQERKRKREGRKEKTNTRGRDDLWIGLIFLLSSRPFSGFCKLYANSSVMSSSSPNALRELVVINLKLPLSP